MNTRSLFPALVSVGLLGLLAPDLTAAFVAFDNFNSYPVGPLNGQGPAGNTWSSPTQPAGSSIVTQSGADRAARLGNPSASIPNFRSLTSPGLAILNTNVASTVYWNFTLSGGLTADNNWNFVVTDDAAPADTAGSSEVQFNYDFGSGTTFRARNAGAFVFLSTNGTPAGRLVPTVGIQYNAWFQINNSADTYQVFLQSPGDPAIATRTLMQSDTGISTFGFRNGAAANTLATINMGNGNAGNGVTFDDIFVDLAGFNAANPIPEPASALLVGVGLLGMFRRRRS